jgi:hypothetical protein
MSTMKTIFVLVLAVLASQQIGVADDSGKIRQLEGEMNSLKQATVVQGEKIQTLKSRVSSRDAAWSATEDPSSHGYNRDEARQNPGKERCTIDSSDDGKYID